MRDSLKSYHRPEWLGNVAVTAGNWEPLAHRRRAGLSCADDAKRYEHEHSKTMVKRLVEAGATAVVWHFFKGLGFEHEKEEMEQARLLGRLCHRHGLKFGTYVNFGSVYSETFFEEVPNAENWLAVDAYDRPHLYSEYFRCYYRKRPCMTSREYVEYVKRVVLHAVEHGGSDWVHFDNTAQMPCYCDNCRNRFRTFLAEKYSSDGEQDKEILKERFGHWHLERMELPRGTARMGIDTLSSLHEPLLQHWVEFRCRLLADAVREVACEIAEQAPAVALTVNAAFDSEEFAPLVWSGDVEKLARQCDLLFSEDGNYPHVTQDGRLVGRLFTFKLGQALDVYAPVHQPGTTKPAVSANHARLALMEAAIFNRGHLGHVYHAADLLDGLDKDDARPPTVRFIRDHRRYFTRTRTLAQVAMLRSTHSLSNNWRDALPSKILMEQTLARYRFQYHVVLESQLHSFQTYVWLASAP